MIFEFVPTKIANAQYAITVDPRTRLGILCNFLGIFIFFSVIACHYAIADPKKLANFMMDLNSGT